MLAYFKLLRFPNLLFIAFIQFVMRQVVVVPILQTFGFDAASDTGMLSLLIAATVLIAAGGYAINDYFDVKIDTINHPDRVLVGNDISRNMAMLLHQILTGTGVLLGLFLAFFARSFSIGLIFIGVAGLLWFYSASYKRMFIVGNLIVSLLASLTILLVGLCEIAFLEKQYGVLMHETAIPQQIYAWILGFSAFAFLCTWIREIIKDIEDEKGDKELECRTMAVKWGAKRSKNFVYGLIAATILLLYVAAIFLIPFPGTVTLRYISFGLLLPFLGLIYLLLKANEPNQYNTASMLCKIIMIIGVLYSFVFYYLTAKTQGISIFNLFVVQ